MTKKRMVILSLISSFSVAGVAVTGTVLGMGNHMSVLNNNENNTITSVVQQSDSEYMFNLSKVEAPKNGDPNSVVYKLEIQENDKKEGSIFFFKNKDNNSDESMLNTLEIMPGTTVYVGVKLNKGYENYTVRDLFVFGKDQNHFVPSELVDGKDNVFSIKFPSYEETLPPDGSQGSWLYDANTSIKVIPTFIVKSIGNDVNWEHGGYFDTVNGYALNMDRDYKWSEVKTKFETYKNDNKTKPINFFFYLNGHKLILDEDVIEPSFVREGWSISFYNNKTETADPTYGWGEITLSEQLMKKGALIQVKGALGLGRGVKYRYIQAWDGIRIIDWENSNNYNTTFSNDPTNNN